jgi:cell division septum initiation protein DivIVA
MALLPNYKDIIDLLKKGASIEAQEKIMELREGAIALQEENSKLKERIKELESELNKKKKYNGMHLSIGLLSENRKKALFVKNAMMQIANL